MKKLFIFIILILSFFLISCNKKRYDIDKITYTTIDYNGGINSTYIIDLVENEYSRWGYVPGECEDGVKTIKSFTDEEKEEFIKGINKAGLLSIKEEYKKSGVIDGGGWHLTIEFSDGTKFESNGSNNSPRKVFDKCSTYFYDLCGEEILGTLPAYYVSPPNIWISFDYQKDERTHVSDNGLSRLVMGNYKWNKNSSLDNDYYQMNLDNIEYNQFESQYDYELGLFTGNYDCDVKFDKIIVKEYDFNKEMTNEKEIYNDSWFKQVSLNISLNKIYVYKLVYKNGDYVEYTFSTGVNNDL